MIYLLAHIDSLPFGRPLRHIYSAGGNFPLPHNCFCFCLIFCFITTLFREKGLFREVIHFSVDFLHIQCISCPVLSPLLLLPPNLHIPQRKLIQHRGLFLASSCRAPRSCLELASSPLLPSATSLLLLIFLLLLLLTLLLHPPSLLAPPCNVWLVFNKTSVPH